jgi:hypothetical protein
VASLPSPMIVKRTVFMPYLTIAPNRLPQDFIPLRVTFLHDQPVRLKKVTVENVTFLKDEITDNHTPAKPLIQKAFPCPLEALSLFPVKALPNEG